MYNTPTDISNCVRDIRLYTSARNAFKFLLQKLKKNGFDSILLPSYIGYTDREGSGVFDPVVSENIEYDFYEIDEKLSANIESLEYKLKSGNFKTLLIIHYFGFCQNDMQRIKQLCEKYKVILVEDCAHSPNSVTEYGKLGEIGDFSFFSIHKYYPTKDGGMLKINNLKYRDFLEPNDDLSNLPKSETLNSIITCDIDLIKKKRRRNYIHLDKLLTNVIGVEKLYSFLPEGITPHNYPLIVKNGLREKLYFELIKNEVPAIALYYRMIEPINKLGFEKSLKLSSSILNLPIHQDISLQELSLVANKLQLSLAKIISQNEK